MCGRHVSSDGDVETVVLITRKMIESTENPYISIRAYMVTKPIERNMKIFVEQVHKGRLIVMVG